MNLVDKLEEDENYTKTGKLVVDMMAKLTKIHLLATDSFYSSEKLCKMLFAFIGSVKVNRTSLPNELKKRKIEKKYLEFYCKSIEIMITILFQIP